MTAARNIAIILVLAALVSFAPGGITARDTIGNMLSVLFFGGLAFFAYRMYMENRTTLFDLDDSLRLVLYASVTTLIFALVATGKFFDEAGALVLLWFVLIGASVYGFVTVMRRWREY